MTDTTCRVAIVGAGKIGGVHLRAAMKIEKVEVVAIADTLVDAAVRTASGSNAKVYSDYREMIRQERPTIAIIALPPFLHREAVEYCADHGCHILLEKPMARSKEECIAIREAVQRNGVQLLVGHSLHYVDMFNEAKKIIDGGTLGELVMMNHNWHAYYFNDRQDWFFSKELSGGGILMNLGSHAIDLIQWFTSSQVVKVKARLHANTFKGDIEASGNTFLETESGVTAVVSLHGYSKKYKNELELLFTGGILRLVWGEGLWLIDNEQSRQIVKYKETDEYVIQLASYIHAIEAGKAPECTGEYGQSIIEVVECIYASHESGTEVSRRSI